MTEKKNCDKCGRRKPTTPVKIEMKILGFVVRQNHEDWCKSCFDRGMMRRDK